MSDDDAQPRAVRRAHLAYTDALVGAIRDYGCANEHAVTTEVCDRCATSLTDGHQRCAKCVLPMVVTDLTRLA